MPPPEPVPPIAIAHRGWHKDHLENTMEAFRAAYAAGCDMVEFDVQLSRDGVPVIFHDDDCRRLAGRREKVSDLPWRELREIRMPGTGGKAGGRKGDLYRIPALEEFLAEFGRKEFYLELKVPDAKAKDMAYFTALGEKAADLVTRSRPRERTFLASFHGPILVHLHRKALFGPLAGIFESYRRFREVYSGKDADVAAAIRWFSVSHGIFKKFAKAYPEEGKDARQFVVWDIAGEKRFRAAAERGVRGVCSDDVEGLAALRRQGREKSF